MKKLSIIMLIVLLLSACTRVAESGKTQSVTNVPLFTPFIATAEVTTMPGEQIPAITSNITISPTKNATIGPTMTNTPFPTPMGLSTYEELETRIKGWIQGDIEFTDEDRLLNEEGQLVRLGLLARQPINMVIVVFYSLGFTIIYDQQGVPYLINIVGFEDYQGNRFTFTFHHGRLTDRYSNINLQILEGRTINQSTLISFEQLTPLEFAQRSEEMIFCVNSGITWEDSRGYTGDAGVDYANRYLLESKDTTIALADFLQCETCSVDHVPSTLRNYINTIPLLFDGKIPYLRIYDVTLVLPK